MRVYVYLNNSNGHIFYDCMFKHAQKADYSTCRKQSQKRWTARSCSDKCREEVVQAAFDRCFRTKLYYGVCNIWQALLASECHEQLAMRVKKPLQGPKLLYVPEQTACEHQAYTGLVCTILERVARFMQP